MAVTDTIIRRGSRDKQVVVGPELLFGPTSDRRHRVGCDVDRITGDVDFYEVTSSFCGIPGAGGTPPGTYSWTISPFNERGFKRPIKAIRVAAVVKLTDEPDGRQTTELLFRKEVPASDRKFTIGPFTTKVNERLFLSIQRMGGVSSIQYQLSLDSQVTRASDPVPVAEKRAKREKPMTEVTEEDKAWDLVKSD